MQKIYKTVSLKEAVWYMIGIQQHLGYKTAGNTPPCSDTFRTCDDVSELMAH